MPGVTGSSNSFCYAFANNNANTDMLQRTRTASPPITIKERVFEGTFFSVALIAMTGWIYFIALLLVRLFLWFFG